MQIIPVLDILGGVVVHGVAGRREQYRPICSQLTESIDPSVILRTMQSSFALTNFYIADLDAIQRLQLNRCTIAELTRGEASLMVDRGVRSARDIQELLELDVAQVIVALETLPDLQTVTEWMSEFGPDVLVASIDLVNGQPVTKNADWGNLSPLQIASQLVDVGFHQLVVLDLAAVGMHSGIPTLPICRELRTVLPAARIIAGGGVRNVADLHIAQQAGIDAVLVASALHNGGLTVEDLQSLRQ